MGAEVLRGDLNDTCVLRAGALDSDGVIHLAYEHRLGQVGGAQADAKAVETFATALAGSGKPMVISGATLVTPGRPATERDEPIAEDPSPPAWPTCGRPSRPQGTASDLPWSCCPARCTARVNVTASSPSS
jgi:hypothetical protein